jgi:hypothetical protein
MKHFFHQHGTGLAIVGVTIALYALLRYLHGASPVTWVAQLIMITVCLLAGFDLLMMVIRRSRP